MSEPLSIALAATYSDLAAAECRVLDLIAAVNQGSVPSSGAFARARNAIIATHDRLIIAEDQMKALNAALPGLAGVSSGRSATLATHGDTSADF